MVSYDLKVQKGMVGKRLSSYCNVCSYVSSFGMAFETRNCQFVAVLFAHLMFSRTNHCIVFSTEVAILCASGMHDAQGFHDGRNGTKERILAFAEETCPKLWAVAQAVAASQQKALVMTSRTCGYLVMLELLRRVAEKSQPPFQVATMDELSTFNHSSNARGQAPWSRKRHETAFLSC